MATEDTRPEQGTSGRTGHTPGRYRKKPVVVEAVQYLPGAMSVAEHKRLLDLFKRSGCDLDISAHCLVITTRVNGVDEGVTRALDGDWIIKGIRGEVYPCKPDIFDATYEAADACDGFSDPSAAKDLLEAAKRASLAIRAQRRQLDIPSVLNSCLDDADDALRAAISRALNGE